MQRCLLRSSKRSGALGYARALLKRSLTIAKRERKGNGVLDTAVEPPFTLGPMPWVSDSDPKPQALASARTRGVLRHGVRIRSRTASIAK